MEEQSSLIPWIGATAVIVSAIIAALTWRSRVMIINISDFLEMQKQLVDLTQAFDDASRKSREQRSRDKFKIQELEQIFREEKEKHKEERELDKERIRELEGRVDSLVHNETVNQRQLLAMETQLEALETQLIEKVTENKDLQKQIAHLKGAKDN